MKKSKHIQLVLITAALSSCSRVILPNEPLASCPEDTTLTRTKVDLNEYAMDDDFPCCQVTYSSLWGYSHIPFGPVYTVPVRNPSYYPGKPPYRKQSSWNGSAVVVRGGFGISAKTVTTLGS